MSDLTHDALRLIRDYVKNVEAELVKFKVDMEPEWLKVAFFDIENLIRISSMRNAMKRKSSKAEVVDVRHTLKKHGKPREFVKSHFKDVKTWLNSQRIIIDNFKVMKLKLQKTKMPKVLDVGCGWGRLSNCR